MTALSVHSVSMLNIQDKKRALMLSLLVPFESFIIPIVGKKRTSTVAQYLLNHSILSTLRKSGLGRKGVCFPHYPQGYSEHAGNFFPFHS